MIILATFKHQVAFKSDTELAKYMRKNPELILVDSWELDTDEDKVSEDGERKGE